MLLEADEGRGRGEEGEEEKEEEDEEEEGEEGKRGRRGGEKQKTTKIFFIQVRFVAFTLQ